MKVIESRKTNKTYVLFPSEVPTIEAAVEKVRATGQTVLDYEWILIPGYANKFLVKVAC